MAGAEAVHTMIPKTSFNSQSDFDTDWNYNYPWGTDHNGGARMNPSQVKFSSGMLTLTAKKVTGQPDAMHGGQKIKINYLSGAIHAKEHFNVSRGGGYDFTGEFKATTTKGTWPAFWLTAVDGWPPEIDMAEWKGSGKISFNTFNTSSILSWKDVTYPSPDQFHSIKCEVRDINQKDLSVKFYMDGSLVTTQIGGSFFGKPMIINLQMEGSSGSPGPSSARALRSLGGNSMKSRYAVAKKLRVPPSTQSRRIKAGSTLYRRLAFANTRLPTTALFDEPGLSILRAPRAEQQKHNWFLLFRRPQPPPPAFRPNTFATKMLNFVQIVTTPTADTSGTALLLHFDNQRYVFGNISEGTQRALVQRKIPLSKIENIFLAGPVDWHSAGGLLGMIMTIADVLSSSKEHTEMNSAAKKKKPQIATTPSKLSVHGGQNLSHLIATCRRFIFRRGLPLCPHEIRNDPRIADGATSEPDWKDTNINVWYMPVKSSQSDLVHSRKRSHDEFREGTEADVSISPEQHDQKLVETVVAQMFDSDWKADALVETTLRQAKLPAKLFVRDDKGHLQVYAGPMPGSGVEVPDIPVLVRQPWPSSSVTSLPRTEPAKQSMCYIVKGHDRRGKFNPQAAERLGVAKQDYRRLANLESVRGEDGAVVTPDMVLGETITGSGFAIVDLPDISYIRPLVNRTEWADSQIMKGIHVIFWILGRDVVNDTRLQDFMQKMSSIRHIVSSADSCPNMIAFESAAAQAYKLRCIDSDRFPLPAYSNEQSLSKTAVTSSSMYETGRTGKTIQFAPQYVHQDDKMVPFPNIEKLARANLDHHVLEMAAQARSKITDPDFIAKVEEVESDIPNRDAEIITLGTGSALPSKYRNVSATLIRVPGYGNYLFDAGENTLGQLRRVFGSELPSVLRDLKVVWISHLHADHHLGTVSVIKAWHDETKNLFPSAKLLVASHTNMINWLCEYADVENYGFERLVLTPFTQYNPKTLLSEERIFNSEETQLFGLEKIEGCWVNHCFGALATVFTFPTGLKIAYSGDCRPSDAFVRIGRGATILIHESTFDDELLGDAIAKKHSTMSEAIDVGRRMGARRILLTHFSQRYPKVSSVEGTFEIVSNAERKDKSKVDEVILVAFDYMRVKLGDFRKAQAFLPAIQKLFDDAEE
ncbi:hypothetical protein F5Y19DRAFT_477634 [Xylariaceae sp. FL1651]|nr:hypothetical protein F5Y19DRAFT_477634 [Xylariaceae sp. FL1651]